MAYRAVPGSMGPRGGASVSRAVLAVIPARYAAQRFPGKPLATLWGKPMVQHVWERARQAQGIDTLVIATDDERIERAARGFGATVERTRPECASGTDRVAEVARRHPEAGIVINLQGDEPELDPVAVARLIAGLRGDSSIRMATLAHAEHDAALLAAPDVVKVGVDADGYALYFTREGPAVERRAGAMLRHIGVYGFTRDFLLEFASWPPGQLERHERLEQLRAVERGVRIRVFSAERASAGIDTPEQLAALEQRGPQT